MYATLGDEAVQFAINEVGAKTIFTSEALISKVKKAMSNGATSIENIIFFDSVDPASRGESVDVDLPFTLLSFDQLLSRGEREYCMLLGGVLFVKVSVITACNLF